MCGVFGIRAPDRDVARVTYFGLFALQHRGQESAGIAVSDEGRLTVLRDMGLVAQVFTEQKLSGLQGDTAIGHTRYSTTGSTDWTNAQPIVQHGRARTVTLGHNGNLTNATTLRDELAADGIRLRTSSDTEVIAALIANDPAPLEDAVANAMSRLEGAYTVVLLANGTLVGFRDPYGFRPLSLGRSAAITCSRPRRARSTSSAPSWSASSRPASWSRSTRAACALASHCRSRTAVRSASSSSSISPGPTRLSAGSRCTRSASAWVSASPRKRRSRPISSCPCPTRAPRLRSGSLARPVSPSPKG